MEFEQHCVFLSSEPQTLDALELHLWWSGLIYLDSVELPQDILLVVITFTGKSLLNFLPQPTGPQIAKTSPF
jgi:hypothetical protein